MKRIPEQKIEGCCECTHLYWNEDWEYSCTISQHSPIEDIDTIPSWCPLKDWQEPQEDINVQVCPVCKQILPIGYPQLEIEPDCTACKQEMKQEFLKEIRVNEPKEFGLGLYSVCPYCDGKIPIEGDEQIQFESTTTMDELKNKWKQEIKEKIGFTVGGLTLKQIALLDKVFKEI